MLPAQVFAQYSNASLNDPWIVFSDNYVYITFDGSGNITALGTSDDSLHPVGSYTVSSLGAVSATVNMIQGSMTLNGQMLNDSTVNFVDTVPKGVSRMIAVTNPAALAGTWNGIIYDSSSQAVLNFQITVNNSGNVTTATGISLVAGKIFEARDSFAAYITTSDANCRYQALQLEGLYLGDSLTGKADLGQHHDTTGNCNSRGHVSLTRTTSSVTIVKNDFEFSTYPNPFSDRLEITLKTAVG